MESIKSRKVNFKYVIFIGIVTVMCGNMLAQNTGLIWDDERYDSLQSSELVVTKDQVLPERFSLQAYAPFAGSQGKLASCVGWSVGYAALSIEQALRHGISDRIRITRDLAHSALFIYNQIKRGDDCQSGASIIDALSFLNANGDCLHKSIPAGANDCSIQITPSLRLEALDYRLPTRGFRAFDDALPVALKIAKIKAHLVAGHPVIIGLEETPPYQSLIGKDEWQIEPRGGLGHAMVITGYQEDRGTFELMNSFGTLWGNHGFINVPMENLLAFTRQAFVLDNSVGDKGRMVTQEPYSIPMNLAMTWFADSQQVEIPLHFGLSDGVYILQEPIDAFAPAALRIHAGAGKCLYIFSLDNYGQSVPMWKYEYPERDTLLRFPEDGWLQFNAQDMEKILVLYSYETLDQGWLSEALGQQPGADVWKKSSSLIPVPPNIRFDNKSIRVSGELVSGMNKVIPIYIALPIRKS